MATYWENSCSFGLRNVFLVSVPDRWFGFFPGFRSGNLFLIAPFSNLCLLVPFVTCASLLNTMFVFIRFSFFMKSKMSPGKFVFSVVASKNDKRCPRKSGPSSLYLSQVKTKIGVPRKVAYLYYTIVYCACLSVVLVAFRFG